MNTYIYIAPVRQKSSEALHVAAKLNFIATGTYFCIDGCYLKTWNFSTVVLNLLWPVAPCWAPQPHVPPVLR